MSAKTGLRVHTSAVILEGKLEAALIFAKESTEYMDKNYPGHNVQVYREVVGEGGKIHWFTDWKNQGELDELYQKFSINPLP